MNILLRLQVKLIVKLWGKVPIRTKVISYSPDLTVRAKYKWLKPKNGVIRNPVLELAWIATVNDLWFEILGKVLIVPYYFIKRD